MRVRPTLMLIAVLVLASFVVPAHAGSATCSTAATAATNVTIGDLLSHGDAPGCSMTLRCDGVLRGACTLKVAGEATGEGLVGVVVSVGENAVAECWAGLGRCATDTATREIPRGSSVTVACAFRNGVSSSAIVTCRGEMT